MKKYLLAFILMLAIVLIALWQYQPKFPELSGTLLVANKLENSVFLFDLKSGKHVSTITTGKEPHEIAVSSDQRLGVIGNYRDPSLTVLDLNNPDDVGLKIPLNEHFKPHGITFLGNTHKVLVTSETQHSLILVDVDAGRIEKTIDTSPHESHMVNYHPQNHWAITTNPSSHSVSIIDLTTDSLIRNIPVGKVPEGIDISPDGREVWIANGKDNSISIIDTEKLEVIENLPTGIFPVRVKFTLDGQYVVVNCKNSKEVNIFNVSDRSLIKTIDLKRSYIEEFFSHTTVPVGLLMHPNGKVAFIAASNSNNVLVLDLKEWEIIGELEAGDHPDGMGFVE